MSVEEFKHLKKGDRIETELRSDKDQKIRMTGTVISKLKRKDNGKEFLIFKMDGNFITWMNVVYHLKSSVSLKQEIKCSRIIDFIRILYTVKNCRMSDSRSIRLRCLRKPSYDGRINLQRAFGNLWLRIQKSRIRNPPRSKSIRIRGRIWYDFIKIVKSQRFFFISFAEMKKNL